MKTLIKLAKELYKGLKKVDINNAMIGYVTGSKQV